ncbi:MAG: OmpA family protein [Flavobacteriales bacterium]|nr:OmpA family protein [Flavobacteriales bacterium]
MKRKLFTLLALFSVSFLAFSQEVEYNRWSVDLNGGLTKPSNPFNAGFYAKTFGFVHGDLGIRYMFNPKFGVKADFGYDQFEVQPSSNRDGRIIRTNVQGVVNLGRVLNFETFAKSLNLQLHSGFGWSAFTSDAFNGTDNMGNFIVGLTGQVKLSNRIALNADFSYIGLISQHYTFDGSLTQNGIPVSEGRTFNGDMYNATIGLSIYLGKKSVHADWYYEDKTGELQALEKRIADLETMLQDTDRDGIPDYLDAENNSIAGVMVDNKGRMIDMNKNGIPDEIEKYVDGKMAKYSSNTSSVTDQEVIKKLINDGYVTTYFDFNKATPTNVSTEGIDFILTYLRNNPSESVQIIGHADEIGKTTYNNKLALQRANNVKNILVKAGIAEGRMTTISAGEDTSVDPASSGARKLVRRVTFKVK